MNIVINSISWIFALLALISVIDAQLFKANIHKMSDAEIKGEIWKQPFIGFKLWRRK